MPHENRAFALALGVSTLFHLSMITLFSVVMVFPRVDQRYAALEIVNTGDLQSSAALAGELLRLTASENPFSVETEMSAAGSRPAMIWPALTQYEPVTLKFEDLGQARVRQAELRLRTQFDDLAEPRAPDSWALFSQGLRSVGPALYRLAFSERLFSERPFSERVSDGTEQAGTIEVHPAPGIVGSIDWITEPKNRKLLLAPTLDTPWNVNAAVLVAPVSLTFTVDAQGKVTEVLAPIKDDTGVVSNVGRALLKYRFEALTPEGYPRQRATLRISAELVSP